MRKLQELTMKLYLDVRLQEKYKMQDDSVLKQFEISADYKKYLPSMTNQSFCVESFGRRFLFARTIGIRFPRFFKSYLSQDEVSFKDIVESNIFKSFLSSDYFYTNEYGLNHYTGIGAGYESCTKFFKFAIDTLDTPKLLEILMTEISAHLHYESKLSTAYPFTEFKKGIYFNVQDKHFLILNDKKLKLSKKPLSMKPLVNFFGAAS